jgi:hypothetical protein
MTPMIPGIVILLVAFVGGLIVRAKEKKDWNNGICAESGKSWVSRDVDSQGGRLYSDMTGHSIWVSWGVDKTRTVPAPQGCLTIAGKERTE